MSKKFITRNYLKIRLESPQSQEIFFMSKFIYISNNLK